MVGKQCVDARLDLIVSGSPLEALSALRSMLVWTGYAWICSDVCFVEARHLPYWLVGVSCMVILSRCQDKQSVGRLSVFAVMNQPDQSG